jgi:uroporphyrinogen-III synthase
VATFASPSALRAFVAGHGTRTLKQAAAVVVIGPATATAATALGLAPVVADAPNVEAVTRAIEKTIRQQGVS